MAAESRLPRGRLLLPAFPHVSRTIAHPRRAMLVLVALAVVGGAATGWFAASHGLLPTAAVLLAIAAAVVVVSDARAALWAVIGVMTLIPFAVIPVHVKLTPTLFEVAALAALGVWLLSLLLHKNERIVTAVPGVWVVLLLAVTVFAFLLGVNNGYTTGTYHDYAKFLLAVLMVFVVWNTTRTLADAGRLVTVLLLGGGAASAIGLVLYAGGASLTTRVLSHLIRYGYPSSDIVRYINSDPSLAMRLTSTSVDPNAFGGLLAVVFVIAAAQAVARNRVISRWVTIPVAALTVIALLLTLSRGAWLGAVGGLLVLAILRYRWIIAPGVAIGLLMLVVGLGASFWHRLWLGLTLQDPATKLRLQEYQNALAIIRAHPLFGVGYGSAGSVLLQIGVSSVYLTIAEEAGFLGVAVYLIAVGSIGIAGLRYWSRTRDTAAGDLQLALLAALASALVVGVFDHYYVDITFPHMVALFWIVCGLILALARPPGSTEIVTTPRGRR
ncbi:MAG TPA: O-antigen ligase family protein [Thermomicrobiaceae bacterium]|nr:O-antigen ligase family protein [Thermomicrobiaceae bacterium]